MKPRLQRLVTDCLFKEFNDFFKHSFKDCENEFIREILCNSTYRFNQIDYDNEDEGEGEKPSNENNMFIIEAGTISKSVHFILRG